MRSFALAALALALAACKGSSGGAPDASVPGTCSSDTECVVGFKCDRQQRRCVCTGDEACPGAFCNAFTGTCVASVPGCTADSACGKTEYCDRGLRSCRTLTAFCGACKTDAECGTGSKCAAHPDYPDKGTYCVPQCQSTDGGAAGCANGLICRARDASPAAESLCYPSKGACGVTNACTADSRKPCSANADCGDVAQVCDQSLKICVAKVRACPAGDSCDPQQLICLQACSSDKDCTDLVEHAPGYQCVASACVKLALCTADSDCTDGQNCVLNSDGITKSCKPGCVANGDCPLGQSCSKADPRHPKCAPGCAVDSDCALNNICVAGACTAVNGGCSQTCQNTIVCPTGSKCDASKCCASVNFSQACPTSQGPDGSKGQNPSYPCTPCNSSTGCPAQPGQCALNCFPLIVKACTKPADCSSPTVCTGGYCQQMVWVQPCDLAASGSCPYKGFSCRDSAAFCGAGGSGGICLPDEQAAQVACLNGHL